MSEWVDVSSVNTSQIKPKGLKRAYCWDKFKIGWAEQVFLNRSTSSIRDTVTKKNGILFYFLAPKHKNQALSMVSNNKKSPSHRISEKKKLFLTLATFFIALLGPIIVTHMPFCKKCLTIKKTFFFFLHISFNFFFFFLQNSEKCVWQLFYSLQLYCHPLHLQLNSKRDAL